MDAMSSWILAMKVFLISAGAVSVIIAIKISIDEAPAICSVILPWMKPPYLFIVINAIIISIAACSRFNQNQPEQPRVQYERLISVRTPPSTHLASLTARTQEAAFVVYEDGERIVELRPVLVNGSEVGMETEEETASDTEAEVQDMFLETPTSSTYDNMPEEKFPPEFQLEYYNPSPVREKPFISSSFAHQNSIRSTSPEGVLEELAAEAEQVTLESMWKKITAARREPDTEDLNKSDTVGKRSLQKSETFKDDRRSNRKSPPAKGSPRIQKELSPSQDELNRRAEDFIKKFNEEMRLQREESLNKRLLSSGA